MKKEDRATLRTQLYERAKRADLGLVEAVKMMRKIAGRTQSEYATLVGVSETVAVEVSLVTVKPVGAVAVVAAETSASPP